MSTLSKLHQAHKDFDAKLETQKIVDRGINLRPKPKYWFGPAESFVPPNAPPDIHKVVSVTMAHFGLTKEDALAHCRLSKHVRARFCAYYLAKEYTGRSQGWVARYFHRDHTTIMYALKQTETKSDLMNEIGKIRRKLGPSK